MESNPSPATGQRRLADEIESVADKIYSQNAIRSRELSAIAAEVAKLEMAARSETAPLRCNMGGCAHWIKCSGQGHCEYPSVPSARAETWVEVSAQQALGALRDGFGCEVMNPADPIFLNDHGRWFRLSLPDAP